MAVKLSDVLVFIGADDSRLEKDLDGSKKKTKSWAGALGGTATKVLGGVVVGAATTAAAAVASVGIAALNVSKETEKAAADMAASLGLPTEEAEKFAEVAKQVYGNNFADSIADAGKSITEVTRQLGFAADDPSLQRITEKALALRDTFGKDVNESVSTAKSLMENFGLSADEAFDLIASGFQQGLNRSDDFLETINEYSVQFGNGGASAEEFFSIMQSGLQGGMLGTDKAADAFKEFRVRILDGSKTTENALAQIGLSADEVTNAIDSGAMSVADAWNLVVGRLKDVEDQSVLMQAGVGLIGTQFEDLGQDAVLSMEITADAFKNAEGAADSLNKRYDTFGSAVSAIWRRLVVSVTPLTDKILDMANAAIPHLMGAFDTFDKQVLPGLLAFGATVATVVASVMRFFENLGQNVDTFGTGRFAFFKEWTDTNLPLLRDLVQNILGAIQVFWEKNGKAITTIVTTTFNTIFTIVDTVLKTTLDLITLVLQILNGDFESAGKTLVNIVSRIWSTIQQIIDTVLNNTVELILGIDWAGLGASMIKGIARGIIGAGSFLTSAAVEAARNAFDAAKGWLGIQSPSKRAATEIGQPFAEGVGKGIQTKLRDVATDVQIGLRELIGEIPQPALASASVGQRSAPSITVNQTFNGRADSEQVREAAAAGILDSMRNIGIA